MDGAVADTVPITFDIPRHDVRRPRLRLSPHRRNARAGSRAPSSSSAATSFRTTIPTSGGPFSSRTGPTSRRPPCGSTRRPEAIKNWPILTLVFPVIAVAAVTAALIVGGSAGRYLFALYLVWSPYHYSRQAYGLSLMYAYRSGMRARGVRQADDPLGLPRAVLLDAPPSGRRDVARAATILLRGLPNARGADADADRAVSRRARRSVPLAPVARRADPAADQPGRDRVQCHLVERLQLLQRLRLGHGLPRAPVPGHRQHLPREGPGASRSECAGLVLPHCHLLRDVSHSRLGALLPLAAGLLAPGLPHRAEWPPRHGHHQSSTTSSWTPSSGSSAAIRTTRTWWTLSFPLASSSTRRRAGPGVPRAFAARSAADSCARLPVSTADSKVLAYGVVRPCRRERV